MLGTSTPAGPSLPLRHWVFVAVIALAVCFLLNPGHCECRGGRKARWSFSAFNVINSLWYWNSDTIQSEPPPYCEFPPVYGDFSAGPPEVAATGPDGDLLVNHKGW